MLGLLKGNIPFANLFYTKEAMNYLVWYQLQETINPGYLRRMERRAKNQNDQTFWCHHQALSKRAAGSDKYYWNGKRNLL